MATKSGQISFGASSFDPYAKSSKYLQGTRMFLTSNGIVAKLAFLILVFFIFIILLRLGISFLSNFFSFQQILYYLMELWMLKN